MKQINRMLNIALYLLVFAVFVLPPLTPTTAADNWVFNDFPVGLEESVKNDQLNSSGYSTHVKIADISGSQLLIGPPIEGVSVRRGAYKNDPQYVAQLYNQSALGHVNNTIIAVYSNPPATTAWAIRDMGESMGIFPKRVHAQGVGFSGLSFLLPLWKTFRNIAYLLLALVLIVIGFMVMLRKKIDPKTIVTVQNALPRVVITLILITFSYAIVGILIDLMYFIILFAVGLMKLAGYLNTPLPAWGGVVQYSTYENLFTNGGLWPIVDAIFPVDPIHNDWGLLNLSTAIIGQGVGWFISGAVVGAIIGSFVNPGGGTLVGGLLGTFSPPVVLALILSMGILFIQIRLLFLFLNAYINIVLSMLISPLQILFEAVPGGNGFSMWLKNLIANLSVFPVAAIMFMIALVFNKTVTTSPNTPIWTAPYLLVPNLGSVDGNASAISALFSMGIIYAIPSVCKSISEALKAKSPISAGPGALFAPISTTLGSGMGVASQFFYTGQIIDSVGNFAKKQLKIK